MKGKLEKYEVYRDSGADWLGKIPSNWGIKRFKFLFTEINERSEDGEGELLSVSQYTGVTRKADKVDDGGLLTTATTLEGYKKVYRNDLVSNIMLAWNGSLGFSPYNGITSPAYSVYRLKKGNSEKYFHYLVRSQIYKSEFKRNSSGVIESRLRLYTDDFFSIASILPPLPEQTAIAQFLDDKTAKIDQAIAQKERLIELLKERKQILIQELVTGKKVWDEATQSWIAPKETVDSGVEWIGEIPKGWEVKKLKFSSNLFRGKFTHRPRNDERLYDGDYPFFQTGDIAKSGKFLIDYKQTLNEKGLRVSTLIPRGTIVITIAANIGDVAILDVDACFPDSIVGFQPKEFICRDFLFYSLVALKEQFISSTIKNTQMNLNVERIGSNSICFPDQSIQKKILAQIEDALAQISISITLQQTQIAKLKEYKSVLIDSAVTGKIRVPQAKE